jgi:hypothetical protein
MIKKNIAKLLLNLFAGTALAVTLTLTTGCFVLAAGAAAGAGTVAYVRGELDATLDRNYEATVRGANLAIQQLEFAKTSEAKDAISDVIKGRTGQDKRVEIDVTRLGDNLTRVQIRIGIFGDEMISRTILDKMKQNL